VAIEQIAAFPNEPQHPMTVTWGDRQVRLRFTWRNRTRSWYLDIFELDDGEETGDAIVRGRRISPQWFPLIGLRPVGLPQDPILIVDGGPDPYLRSDLGEGVRALLVGLDDLPPVTVTSPNLTVTIQAP